ncbi:hypothetical protein AGMMS50233_02780 [Endomicrobiia bacterium]|nr:hypothetical protein AGMMS50233_02780 [Endomicrobiia bacterium]
MFCATSTVDNPEPKEALIVGEIDFVFCSCHSCGEMFHAERFILYYDSNNELITFVYPLSFREQAAQYKAKTSEEFKFVLDDYEEKQKIKYEPLSLFGTENLVSLLRVGQGTEDEESILKYIAPKLSLDIIKISPNLARRLGIPKILPVAKGKKNIKERFLISGLETLKKYNSNPLHYIESLEKILRQKTIITDVKNDSSFILY